MAEPIPFCHYNEHIWVQVVDGATYDDDFDTQVCVKCLCHRAIRINPTH